MVNSSHSLEFIGHIVLKGTASNGREAVVNGHYFSPFQLSGLEVSDVTNDLENFCMNVRMMFMSALREDFLSQFPNSGIPEVYVTIEQLDYKQVFF